LTLLQLLLIADRDFSETFFAARASAAAFLSAARFAISAAFSSPLLSCGLLLLICSLLRRLAAFVALLCPALFFLPFLSLLLLFLSDELEVLEDESGGSSSDYLRLSRLVKSGQGQPHQPLYENI
jgi:hypothetical protein